MGCVGHTGNALGASNPANPQSGNVCHWLLSLTAIMYPCALGTTSATKAAVRVKSSWSLSSNMVRYLLDVVTFVVSPCS